MKRLLHFFVLIALLSYSCASLAFGVACTRAPNGIPDNSKVGQTYQDVWNCTSEVPAAIYTTVTLSQGQSEGFLIDPTSTCQNAMLSAKGSCTIKVNFTPAKAGTFSYAFRVNISPKKGVPPVEYNPFGPISTTASGIPPVQPTITWPTNFPQSVKVNSNGSCETQTACQFPNAIINNGKPTDQINYTMTSQPAGKISAQPQWSSAAGSMATYSLSGAGSNTTLTVQACIQGTSICKNSPAISVVTPSTGMISWNGFPAGKIINTKNGSCLTGADNNCFVTANAQIAGKTSSNINYSAKPVGGSGTVTPSSWQSPASGSKLTFTLTSATSAMQLEFTACEASDPKSCISKYAAINNMSSKTTVSWPAGWKGVANIDASGACKTDGCSFPNAIIKNGKSGDTVTYNMTTSNTGSVSKQPVWAATGDAAFALKGAKNNDTLTITACLTSDSKICASPQTIKVSGSVSKLLINWPGKDQPYQSPAWSNSKISGRLQADACVVTTSTDYNIKTRNCDPDYNVQYNVFLTSSPSVSTIANGATGVFSLPQAKFISGETVTVKVQATKDGKVDPSITPVTTAMPVSGGGKSGFYWPGQDTLAASAQGASGKGSSDFNVSYVPNAYWVGTDGSRVTKGVTYSCAFTNLSYITSPPSPKCPVAANSVDPHFFFVKGDFASSKPTSTVTACYNSHCISKTISYSQGAVTVGHLVWASFGEKSTAVFQTTNGGVKVKFNSDACIQFQGRSGCISSYKPRYLVSSNPIDTPSTGYKNTFCSDSGNYLDSYPNTIFCAGGSCACSSSNGCLSGSDVPQQIYIKAIMCPGAYKGAVGLPTDTAAGDPIPVGKTNGQCTLTWKDAKNVKAIYNASSTGQNTRSIYFPKNAVVTSVTPGGDCSDQVTYSAEIIGPKGAIPVTDIGPSFYNGKVGSYLINSNVLTSPTSAAVVTATYGSGADAISISSPGIPIARVNDPRDPNLGKIGTPTKVLRIYNNSTHTIYPVIEAAKQPVGQPDYWLQAEFEPGSAKAKNSYFNQNLYRIYVNGTDGIAPGQSVFVNLPLYTHICNGNPTQSSGCQNNASFKNNYIDWWRGGRVYIYANINDAMEKDKAAQNAIAAGMKADATTSPVYVDAAPVQCDLSDQSTAKNCNPLSLTIYQGFGPDGGADLPPNDPQQLVEYTLGGVYVNACTNPTAQQPCQIDLSAVDYDISYVDNAYLPISMENYISNPEQSGYNQVGYVGSMKKFDFFDSTINAFTGTPWPSYKISDQASTGYPRVPGGYNVWQNLDAMTDPQPARNNMAGIWHKVITQIPANPTAADLAKPASMTPVDCSGLSDADKKVCNVWNYFIKNYSLALPKVSQFCPGGHLTGASKTNPNAPTVGSMMSRIYGWVPFNGCLDTSAHGHTFPNALVDLCAVNNDQNQVSAFCSTTGTQCTINPNPHKNTCFIKPGYDYSNVSAGYKDMMYQYQSKTDPVAFNPYVKLIHQDLGMSAYAFSIDDAVGNMNEQGDGLYISAGGTKATEFPSTYAFSYGMQVTIAMPADKDVKVVPVYYAIQSGANPSPVKNYRLIGSQGVFISDYKNYPKTVSVYDNNKSLIGSFRVNCPPVQDTSGISGSKLWWDRVNKVGITQGSTSVIHPVYCTDGKTKILTLLGKTSSINDVFPNIQSVRDTTVTGSGTSQKVLCAKDNTICQSSGTSYVSLPVDFFGGTSAQLSWFGKLKNWLTHLI